MRALRSIPRAFSAARRNGRDGAAGSQASRVPPRRPHG